MSMHPRTHAFASLLNAREAWDAQVAAAISALFSDYTDEKKADLYAMIVEGVRPGMAYGEMVSVVDTRLKANDLFFQGRTAHV